MNVFDFNPFMRYAALQPSIMSSPPLSCSYDHRIFYIEEGEGILVLQNEKIPLDSGSLIYLPSDTPYYFEGNIRVIVINFDFTRQHSDKKKPLFKSKNIVSFDKNLVLESDLPNDFQSEIIIRNAFDIAPFLEKCLVCNIHNSEIADAQSSALIKYVLCYILQRKKSGSEELPPLVQRVILYIKQNYDKEITNGKIGEVFGYHSYYLNRLFKSSMGITIHQALIKERIKISKRLLAETELPINVVALESGFSNQAQFSNLFRKYECCTPYEYRKNKKQI